MSKVRNVVIVHAHDMGRYNAAYGHALPTPRMAAFARQGTLFRDAHAVAPTCTPSRAGLLFGKMPHQTGLNGLAHRGWEPDNLDEHLAAWLSKQGLHSVLAGVQHEFPERLEAGPYDEHITRYKQSFRVRDLQAAEAVTGWLRERDENDSDPFFLWAGLFLPHTPYLPADTERFPPDYLQLPPILPDTAEIRREWCAYATSLERADQCFGMILDAIRDGGFADETLVILTTDHGIPFPGMKCDLSGHGTGITLALHYPGNPMAGRVCDALVSQLDLYPSICELLGVEKPDGLLGKSLLPLLEGKATVVREESYSELSYHAAYEPHRSVRTKRWNYIRCCDEDLRRPVSNLPGGPSTRHLLEVGYGARPMERERLYDLLYDPQERHNLAEDPAYAPVLEQLQSSLDQWLEETDDLIRHGAIPMPTGARCCTREATGGQKGPFVEN